MTWHPDIPEEYRNQIVTGDARELAKRIPDESVDVAIFDPPYGIRWQSSRRIASKRFDPIAGDDAVDGSWLPNLMRCLVPGGAAYIFTRWDVMQVWRDYIEGAGLNVRSCLVWDKGFHGAGDLRGAWAPQHELILFATKGRHILQKRLPDVIRHNRIGGLDLVHPAQKPVGLMAPMIEASCPMGGIVTDWFAGSGTVSVSARQLGRNYIAFEIDPDTAEMARARVRNTQPPLFVLEPVQESLL